MFVERSESYRVIYFCYVLCYRILWFRGENYREISRGLSGLQFCAQMWWYVARSIEKFLGVSVVCSFVQFLIN